MTTGEVKVERDQGRGGIGRHDNWRGKGEIWTSGEGDEIAMQCDAG